MNSKVYTGTAFHQMMELLHEQYINTQGGPITASALLLNNGFPKSTSLVDWIKALAINATVTEVLELTAAEARQAGVRVASELAPGLPRAAGVSIQIHQVLVNLVRNAIEALSEVAGDRRRLTVTTTRQDDRVRVAVVDTGPGLAEPLADTVFDPFTSGKEGGMGLGLSISRSIIDNHGGVLVARNRGHFGACFYFELPLAEEAE